MNMNVVGYANDGSIEVVIDGATYWVPDDMTNRHRQELALWEAEGNTIPSYTLSPMPPYTLPLSVFWARMTDDEAKQFDAAMSTALPLRMRKSFNSSTVLKPDEAELFVFVRDLLTSVTNTERTKEIMSPPQEWLAVQQEKAEEEE